MGSYVYNFDTCARVLEAAEPITYNGSWEVIKGGLIESGEITESAGVIQKVVSVQTAATETATTGETLSTLCAMDVAETEVAGGVVTTLTPKAAVAFTPKTVALCAIAGTVGLDFGFRVGQNLVNLYYGDDWDWDAPGIFDAAKGLIRTYIKADGTTYYDEETIDAITNRLNDIGAFDSGGYVVNDVVLGGSYSFGGINTNNIPEYALKYLPSIIDKINKDSSLPNLNESDIINLKFVSESSYWILALMYYPMSHNKYPIKFSNRLNVDGSYTTDERYLNLFNQGLKNGNFSDNSTEYIILSSDTGNSLSGAGMSVTVDYSSEDIFYGTFKLTNDLEFDMEVTGSPDNIYTVNIGHSSSGGIPDVEKQPEATVPTNFPLEIPEVYPDWSAETLTNPDSNANIYPVKMPNTNPNADLATNPQADAQKGLNPNPDADKSIKDAIDNSPQPVEDLGLDPNPPSPTEDIGKLPIPVVPATGIQGTGFVAIYNPTQSQLAAFSQYMWSKNFIDNISKLFEDPMQAIIGLHMIYATPSRGADHNIVCGYLDSGVTSRTVSSQYINMACGAIKINRYFGNILDYAPYTKVQLFLPFIGVVNLDTNEVMNSILNVTYRVDVLTGACLAQISVSRSDYGAVMYTFSGNCAVQLPISGGNYSSIIANTIGIGASIGATLASGGALAPVLVAGAATAVSNSHLSVAHSGSIGANAGALGGKIPYLIITRPKPYNANNYNNFYGYPSNVTIKLSSCSGYTRVKDIHLEHISRATDDELNEIESLLKEGVII